jgi:hypothetical protein
MNPPYWNVCRRVYLLWAIIIFVGFIATHFHQLPEINYLWLLLSAIGLGYMGLLLQKIHFRDLRLVYIGILWLLTIAFGLMISIITFIYQPLAELTAYLGIFWLFLMAIAHVLNGIIDRNRTYLLTGGMQAIAGAACLVFSPLQAMQYLAAGLVGSLAMVGLVVGR